MLVFLVQRFGKWNLRIDDVIAQEILARAERFYQHVDSVVVNQRLNTAIPTGQTTLTAAFDPATFIYPINAVITSSEVSVGRHANPRSLIASMRVPGATSTVTS